MAVKKGVEKKQRGKSVEEVKAKLIDSGFLEQDAEALAKKELAQTEQIRSKSVKLFLSKEFFDRVGYGFGSQQFVNILFYLTGASIFWVGAINGLKIFLTTVISLVLREYSKITEIKNSFVGFSGVVVGFSFLFMSIAYVMHSALFFALSMLLGAAGAVSYGNLYIRMLKESLKAEKRGRLLGAIPYYGLFITGVALLISAFLMDKYPVIGTPASITLAGNSFSFTVYGCLVVFELAAISFIISGYILSLIKTRKHSLSSETLPQRLQAKFESFAQLDLHKNPIFIILLSCSIIVSMVQILANSYYGIFIYTRFFYDEFGGFMNVAVIFIMALIASIIGPAVTDRNAKEYGKFPMLVFGTLLMAITPLTYYYNPNIISITIAMIAGVVGSSIVGVAQGLFAADILKEKEQKAYYSALGFISILPVMIVVPMGAFIADKMGMSRLFLLLGLLLIIVSAVYFVILVVNSKKGKI